MSVTISGSDHSRHHPRFPEFFASVDLDVDDPCFVNWCNGNAGILFDLLGLGRGSSSPAFEGDLHGEAPLADVRRAIVRARATLDRRGPALARPEVTLYGAPRVLPDRTVELRPLRLLSMGLDVEGMRTRLDAFERCVNALTERGATHITWG